MADYAGPTYRGPTYADGRPVYGKVPPPNLRWDPSGETKRPIGFHGPNNDPIALLKKEEFFERQRLESLNTVEAKLQRLNGEMNDGSYGPISLGKYTNMFKMGVGNPSANRQAFETYMPPEAMAEYKDGLAKQEIDRRLKANEFGLSQKDLMAREKGREEYGGGDDWMLRKIEAEGADSLEAAGIRLTPADRRKLAGIPSVADQPENRGSGEIISKDPKTGEKTGSVSFAEGKIEDKPAPEVLEGEDKPAPEMPEGEDKPAPEMPEGEEQPAPEMPEGEDKPAPEVPVAERVTEKADKIAAEKNGLAEEIVAATEGFKTEPTDVTEVTSDAKIAALQNKIETEGLQETINSMEGSEAQKKSDLTAVAERMATTGAEQTGATGADGAYLQAHSGAMAEATKSNQLSPSQKAAIIQGAPAGAVGTKQIAAEMMEAKIGAEGTEGFYAFMDMMDTNPSRARALYSELAASWDMHLKEAAEMQAGSRAELNATVAATLPPTTWDTLNKLAQQTDAAGHPMSVVTPENIVDYTVKVRQNSSDKEGVPVIAPTTGLRNAVVTMLTGDNADEFASKIMRTLGPGRIIDIEKFGKEFEGYTNFDDVPVARFVRDEKDKELLRNFGYSSKPSMRMAINQENEYRLKYPLMSKNADGVMTVDTTADAAIDDGFQDAVTLYGKDVTIENVITSILERDRNADVKWLRKVNHPVLRTLFENGMYRRYYNVARELRLADLTSSARIKQQTLQSDVYRNFFLDNFQSASEMMASTKNFGALALTKNIWALASTAPPGMLRSMENITKRPQDITPTDILDLFRTDEFRSLMAGTKYLKEFEAKTTDENWQQRDTDLLDALDYETRDAYKAELMEGFDAIVEVREGAKKMLKMHKQSMRELHTSPAFLGDNESKYKSIINLANEYERRLHAIEHADRRFLALVKDPVGYVGHNMKNDLKVAKGVLGAGVDKSVDALEWVGEKTGISEKLEAY